MRRRIVLWVNRFLRNPIVELLNSLLAIAILLLFFLFVYDHRDEIGPTIITIIQTVLPVLTMYILIVRFWRFTHSRKDWLKRRRSLHFEILSRNYKKALKSIRTTKVLKDNSGTIYSYQKASSENLDQLILFARKAWDIKKEGGKELRSFQWRKQYMNRIFKIYPSSFYNILRGQEVIGYASVIPMKSGTHFLGQKSQYDFDNSDVSETKSNLVYLQAIYVLDEHQNKMFNYIAALRCLLNAVSECSNDLKNTVLYAEAFTPDGIKLLERMGFDSCQRQSFGGHPKPIYSLSLNWDYEKEEFHKNEIYVNALDTIRTLKKIHKK